MSQTAAPKAREESVQRSNLELLVFSVGGEEFAFPLATVREIIPLQPTTLVPHAPASIRGVFNLRGKVVTLLDLPELLQVKSGEGAHIIVCEKAKELVGILVQMVSGIIRTSESDLHAANEFLPESDKGSFVKGAVILQEDAEGKKDETLPARIILVLDTQKILSSAPGTPTNL